MWIYFDVMILHTTKMTLNENTETSREFICAHPVTIADKTCVKTIVTPNQGSDGSCQSSSQTG